jgi:hypothetical protein
MSGAKRPIARRLALAFAAIAVTGAASATALDADQGSARRASASSPLPTATAPVPTPAPHAPSPRCGLAAAAIATAAVDTAVAQGIYSQELHSREVSRDRAHVTSSQALLSALEGTSEAAVYAAVHAIVYTPHWHIVRLRIIKAGRVIADVGGPDVIAPVSGSLRWKGKTLATYLMAVQDDLGYVKLVSRFIGIPVDLYSNGKFLMGTLQPPPPSSGATSVSIRGSSYLLRFLSARAFPSGSLRVALLIPSPSTALAAESCASVALAAWGNVATHIAARLEPLQEHYQALVDVLHGTTGGPAYVRSGPKPIAGGRLPRQLPSSGTIDYGGRRWSVYSWEPVPPARVYFLTPVY